MSRFWTSSVFGCPDLRHLVYMYSDTFLSENPEKSCLFISALGHSTESSLSKPEVVVRHQELRCQWTSGNIQFAFVST